MNFNQQSSFACLLVYCTAPILSPNVYDANSHAHSPAHSCTGSSLLRFELAVDCLVSHTLRSGANRGEMLPNLIDSERLRNGIVDMLLWQYTCFVIVSVEITRRANKHTILFSGHCNVTQGHATLLQNSTFFHKTHIPSISIYSIYDQCQWLHDLQSHQALTSLY